MHFPPVRWLCALIVIWSSLPAAAQNALLPEPPSRQTLAYLAEHTTGNALGAVLASRAAADGVEYPTRLKVFYTGYGTLPHDEIVDFAWDAKEPPLLLGATANRAGNPHPLCLFDKDKRLLCVSFEQEERKYWLLSTVGMARVPSTRFSAAELELAWHAAQRDRGGNWIESLQPRDLDSVWSLRGTGDPDIAPGHVELWFRFGSPGKRGSYSREFSTRRKLEAPAIERVLWCTWDPCAEHAALHALIDNGLSVPSTPFQLQSTRLCASVARGDEAARKSVLVELARLEKFLSWKPAEPHSAEDVLEHKALLNEFGDGARQAELVETAAYGSNEALPVLRALMPHGIQNCAFAWLRLGGSAAELIALREDDVLQIPSSELARAGTLDALELLLLRLSADLERSAVPHLGEDLTHLDRLIGVLGPKDPGAVLELVRPALRGLIRDPPAYRLSLLLALLRAGDESALEDLGNFEWPEHWPAWVIARELASVPGQRAVVILTRLLLRARAGYRSDHSGHAAHDVAAFSRVLHQRSAADRALALQIFDAELQHQERQLGSPVDIRWALGELPTAEQLRDMEPSGVVLDCRLSLEAESARYATLLSELRAEPRKYWLQLALLRDESALPKFGEWLQASVAARESIFDPLRALRMLADPAAARFFDAEPQALLNGNAESYFTALGWIESPAALPSVAKRCLAAKSSHEELAWHEFLILLGRRN